MTAQQSCQELANALYVEPLRLAPCPVPRGFLDTPSAKQASQQLVSMAMQSAASVSSCEICGTAGQAISTESHTRKRGRDQAQLDVSIRWRIDFDTKAVIAESADWACSACMQIRSFEDVVHQSLHLRSQSDAEEFGRLIQHCGKVNGWGLDDDGTARRLQDLQCIAFAIKVASSAIPGMTVRIAGASDALSTSDDDFDE